MKTELKLFKFYEEERGEGIFQVLRKEFSYITVWGNRDERIGRFLIYEEDLEKNEYKEITKEEFLKRMKMYAENIQHTIDKIEYTSEEEYEEERQTIKDFSKEVLRRLKE